MSLAQRVNDFLTTRAAVAAGRLAERSARDAFIQTAFPLLNQRFGQVLEDAVGSHARLNITTSNQTLTVIGRSFPSLPQPVRSVSALIDAVPVTLQWTPVLDFRMSDQFGLIQCMPGAPVTPRYSQGGKLLRYLLEHGIVMRGRSSAHLLIAPEGEWIELGASHLELALAECFLR
jgi:hypothetical protein